MLSELRSDFIKFIMFMGIFAIISALWQVLEIIEFGQPQSSISDIIFGILLAYSFYKNLHIKVGGISRVEED